VEIIVRKATAEEISSFVVPTWLNSYCLSFVGKLMRADSRHGVGRAAYWSEQRAKIERVLSTSTTSVRVAAVDGEPVGWVAYDEQARTIHFIFVGRVFRRQGIAKSLMPAFYTDHTQAVYLKALPPPWYSRPGPNGEIPIWPQHCCIDLIG